MTKHILLLRHSRCEANDEKKYIGCRTDVSLSETGIREAELLKEEIRSLAGERPQIFSSPMTRAVQTAKLLFEDENIQVLQDLKETDFGLFEGRNYYELKDDPLYQKWIDSNGKGGFPGGENTQDFIERSVGAFYEVLEKSNGSNICIICHGGNIMAVMSRLTGRDFYDFHVDTLDGYILEIKTDGKRVFDFSYDRFGVRISS